jgi:hypothetical protein
MPSSPAAATPTVTDAEVDAANAAADAALEAVLTTDPTPDLTCYSLWAQLVPVLLQVGWTPEDLTADLADFAAESLADPAAKAAPTEEST